MSAFNTEVYGTDQILPITPFTGEFFNGAVLSLQMNSVWPYFALLFLVTGFVLMVRRPVALKAWRVLTLSLMSFLSVLLSLKVSQGWDELFINLKHAYVFRETGWFSYNAGQLLEGTVDFLPFCVAGLLGKYGLPLPETLVTITLLGNVVVILAGWLIARTVFDDEGICAIFALGMGLMPCVLYVGGTGFTATLFSGWILFIIYFVFCADQRRRWIGLVLLALLTAVRTEGIALAFLIWFYLYGIPSKGQSFRDYLLKAMVMGIFLAAPFFIMTIYRKLVFGYPLPNPITFKNTGGDREYLMAGLRQLWILIRYYHLHYYGAVALVPFLYCLRRKILPLKTVAGLMTVALFCSLYFTGGGDWFPNTWGRYLMPFILLFVLFSWMVIQRVFNCWANNVYLRRVIAFVIICLAYGSNSPFSAYKALVYDLQKNSNRWERIDHLSYFGRYLRLTTSPGTVIGSPEMATVMYFAERDLVDLLGIANPAVAHAPLNPILPADLMHRRRFPPTIAEHKPGILCLFGMVQMKPFDVEKQDDNALTGQLVSRFLDFHTKPVYSGMLTRLDIAYYRAGPIQDLFDLGYRHLIVGTPRASFYYFVHSSVYEEHLALIKKFGMTKKGDARIEYGINPALEEKLGRVIAAR